MRSPLFHLSAAVVCLAAGTSAHGFGGQIAVGMNAANQVDEIGVAFTADATLETAEQSIQSKIYFDAGDLRDEINVGGQQLVYIARADADVIRLLMPANNIYMEVPHGESSEQVQEFRLVEHELVGEETVNGMETTKHRVIYESNDGRYGGFTWFDEHNIAVRSFMATEHDGERTQINYELTNLEVGPVDAGLFELPAGAQKLDMSGLLGGAAAAFGGGGSESGGAEGEAVAPDVVDEMLDAAQQGAQDAAVDETRRGAEDAVRRGIRGIFGRD